MDQIFEKRNIPALFKDHLLNNHPPKIGLVSYNLTLWDSKKLLPDLFRAGATDEIMIRGIKLLYSHNLYGLALDLREMLLEQLPFHQMIHYLKQLPLSYYHTLPDVIKALSEIEAKYPDQVDPIYRKLITFFDDQHLKELLDFWREHDTQSYRAGDHTTL